MPLRKRGKILLQTHGGEIRWKDIRVREIPAAEANVILAKHGAAGFELDRVDTRLGSPENAVVIAASEDHPPDAPWVLVPEEQLTHITTIPGETHKQLIRADMTYFDCPGGGEVFAVGSITFCGSLPSNDFDNDVSRILDNVLKRFSR